jgi:hypothetical protein
MRKLQHRAARVRFKAGKARVTKLRLNSSKRCVHRRLLIS